jgi:hypothetical protein
MLFERFPHLMIGPIVATLAWAILIGVLAWVLVFKTRLFNPFDKVRFDSFFCGLLNIIFVFFMAFMGSEFYESHKAASDSLMRERAAIQRVLSIELPTEALNQQVQGTIKSYLQAVVDIEWKQFTNREQSETAQQASIALTELVFQARRDCDNQVITHCIDTLTMGRYLNAVDALREERDLRFSLGVYDREGIRYLLCMFLALNAAISLLLVYKQDKRAALVPLVMYCLSVWVTFLIVVLHAEPYVGFRGVEPSMLENVLQKLS